MFIRKNKPLSPLYSTLSNLEVILDPAGLRYNTTNASGVVTSGGIVTSIISGSPAVAHTFSTNEVGLSSQGIKLIDGFMEFNGGVVMRSTAAATTWNFLHYNSPASDIKYTVHMVLCISDKAVPNQVYGLYGTNGSTLANRGTQSSFDDRVVVPNSDGLNTFISAGGGVTIVSTSPDDLITPMVPFVYSEETDMSQAAANRRKHYINGVLFAHTALSPSTAVVSVPANTLEIGGTGGGVRPFRGWIGKVVIQRAIESSGVFNAFVASLLPYKNQRANLFYNTDSSFTYSVYNTYAPAGRYFFSTGMCQSPVSRNIICEAHHNGDEHVEADDKYLGFRKSLDYGRTWSAESVLLDYDTTGPYSVQSSEMGYTSDNRLHVLSDWHTLISTPGGTNVLIYSYSDDDGDNWTHVDITSQLPANGLALIRAHGKIIESGSYVYATLYMQTDEGDNTDTAVYVMRKPTGSSTTWTFFLVVSSPSATVYYNEAYLEWLDASTLVCLIRNETTKEYSLSRGTSDGSSWTAPEAASFGETYGVGAPPLLSSFYITNENTKVRTRCIAAWIAKRDGTKNLKRICGTADAIAASGYAGFDQDTKLTVTSGTQTVHYGGICHLFDNLEALGAFALEQNPAVETENSYIIAHMPSNDYNVVKTELGL